MTNQPKLERRCSALDEAKRPTVHLVYPYGNRVSCPDAIGRNVAKYLRKHFAVAQYDWMELNRIEPDDGDILVGHACPLPLTVFRRSIDNSRWSRRILLSPHCHGDNHQPAFNDRLIDKCDLYLAITGKYWFDDINKSLFRRWTPKVRHLDLAIERSDFPSVKTQFNPKGMRKFVYIGSAAWYKNTEYLSEIASYLPAGTISWIGSTEPLANIRVLGRMDFSTIEAREILRSFDFMITVGNADGNPATILEAMSWGLLPVCTPQSGYANIPGIINIPLDNAAFVAAELTRMQMIDDAELLTLQKLNESALASHFNWDRFGEQVLAAIESSESPQLGHISIGEWWRIRTSEIFNPFWIDVANPRKVFSRLQKAFRAKPEKGHPA